MRLYWWSYSQKFWLLCDSAQLKGKKKKFILRSYYFNYFIDFFSLFFLFLFFHLCSSVSLIFSTLSFSCSFLFSKLSLLLLKFFTQILFFFFSNFLSFFSIFSLLCEGLFFCCVGVGVDVVGHAMGVGVVSHRFRVMPWVWACAVAFMGLVVGFVWWVISVMVIPWVWWVISFGSCRGFYFCGCGLIFLGSCGLILVVAVVGCVKWWLTGGCDCFFF